MAAGTQIQHGPYIQRSQRLRPRAAPGPARAPAGRPPQPHGEAAQHPGAARARPPGARGRVCCCGYLALSLSVSLSLLCVSLELEISPPRETGSNLSAPPAAPAPPRPRRPRRAARDRHWTQRDRQFIELPRLNSTLSGRPSASHATLSPDRASVTAFTPYWNQCLEPYAQRISSGEMPCEGLRRRPRAVNSSGRSVAEGVRGRRRPAHRRALTYLLSSTY